MARYDVYPNPNREDCVITPYLLDVQHNFLEIETRVVVPLHDAGGFRLASVRDLNPELDVQQKLFIMNKFKIKSLVPYEITNRSNSYRSNCYGASYNISKTN